MRDLLRELAGPDQREFVQWARRRSFAAGNTVFWQGDHGDSVHLVTKGSFLASVSTAQGQNLIVNVFHNNDVFGELALFGLDNRRSATITALEPSETRSLTRERFNEWRSHSPELDRLIVDALADRLREVTDQMMESLYLSIDVRVMRRILLLHEAYAPHSSPEVWLPIRQEELASYCGIARATVNRVLGQLAEQGLVELRRGRLRVANESALRRRANPESARQR